MTDLSEALKPRVDEEKTMLIKMLPGKRPEVTFTGVWTGKFVKGAIDSIAKAYRVQGRVIRRTSVTPTLKVEIVKTQVNPEGGK